MTGQPKRRTPAKVDDDACGSPNANGGGDGVSFSAAAAAAASHDSFQGRGGNTTKPRHKAVSRWWPTSYVPALAIASLYVVASLILHDAVANLHGSESGNGSGGGLGLPSPSSVLRGARQRLLSATSEVEGGDEPKKVPSEGDGDGNVKAATSNAADELAQLRKEIRLRDELDRAKADLEAARAKLANAAHTPEKTAERVEAIIQKQGTEKEVKAPPQPYADAARVKKKVAFEASVANNANMQKRDANTRPERIAGEAQVDAARAKQRNAVEGAKADDEAAAAGRVAARANAADTQDREKQWAEDVGVEMDEGIEHPQPDEAIVRPGRIAGEAQAIARETKRAAAAEAALAKADRSAAAVDDPAAAGRRVATGGIIQRSVSTPEAVVNLLKKSKGLTNVALDGHAAQSHWGGDGYGPAAGAIDGNRDGHFASGSVSETRPYCATWWLVQLPHRYEVEHVVVWGRSDAGWTSKLSDFEIELLADRDVDGDGKAEWAVVSAVHHEGPIGDGGVVTVATFPTGKILQNGDRCHSNNECDTECCGKTGGVKNIKKLWKGRCKDHVKDTCMVEKGGDGGDGNGTGNGDAAAEGGEHHHHLGVEAVRIRMRACRALSMAEVEVYGRPVKALRFVETAQYSSECETNEECDTNCCGRHAENVQAKWQGRCKRFVAGTCIDEAGLIDLL